jgi:hypothetical protein
VEVADNYAFVAANASDLQVFDVADPENPHNVGSLYFPGHANDLTLAGGYLYVAADTSGLHVIDVSTPTSPQRVGSTSTPGPAWDVTISGDYAYISGLDSGLFIADVSDPTLPWIVGSADTPDSLWTVSVAGEHVYAAGGDCGLLVIDATDPSAPHIVGSLETQECARGIVAVDGCAYIADATAGLRLVDISDPSSPYIMGGVGNWFDRYCDARDVVIADYIYVAARWSFRIIPRQCGPTEGLRDESGIQSGPRLIAWPNPSNGRTNIRFEMPASGIVRASIHGPSGRAIRQLAREPFDPGVRALTWDGCDERGRPVVTGIYLVRLSSPRGLQTTRVAILR